MLSLTDLIGIPPAWHSNDPTSEGIVMSSRIRLARNLSGRSFRPHLDESEQLALVDSLEAAIANEHICDNGFIHRIDQLSETERALLFERRLISRELANGNHPCTCAISDDTRLSLMLNEEDHVRLQSIQPGLALERALDQAVACDQTLEGCCQWAVDGRYGYLTACPTNVGTGMRASVMMHLAALAESDQLAKALRGLSKLHLTARGSQGEGSEATGHFYQISNQRTLGHTEADVIDQVAQIAEQLIDYERMAREHLMSRKRVIIEDKIFRGLGLLQNARLLSSKELIEQGSLLRLGSALAILPLNVGPAVDQLLITGLPAHLETLHSSASTAEKRDRLRAELVRDKLADLDLM